MVEHLLRMCYALGSIPSTAKNIKLNLLFV
jgi:hypothetical protein